MAYISSITDINGNNYSLKAVKSAAILTGEILPGVDDDDNEALTAYVEDLTELYDGVSIYLFNDFADSSSSGFTLNVNNLGAKPVYYSTYLSRPAVATFYVGTSMLFVYNSWRVEGGCWDMVYDSPSKINQFGGGRLYQFDANDKLRTYLEYGDIYLYNTSGIARTHLSSAGLIESKDESNVVRTKLDNNGLYIYNSSGTLTDYVTSGNVKSNNIYPLNQATHKIADFVYEQGTASSWTYRKWHSGKAECWRTVTFTKAASAWSTWATNAYITSGIGPYTYPFTFTAIPTEIALLTPNSTNDNNVWGASIVSTVIGSTSSTSTYQGWRPTKPTTTAYYRLNIYAVGTI